LLDHYSRVQLSHTTYRGDLYSSEITALMSAIHLPLAQELIPFNQHNTRQLTQIVITHTTHYPHNSHCPLLSYGVTSPFKVQTSACRPKILLFIAIPLGAHKITESYIDFLKTPCPTVASSIYVLPSEAEDNLICTVAEEKDLGIVFDGQLKFSSHIKL